MLGGINQRIQTIEKYMHYIAGAFIIVACLYCVLVFLNSFEEVRNSNAVLNVIFFAVKIELTKKWHLIG
jgi:hypothetical protein